ncbi:hypothetical protein C7M38_01202 [Lactiplantibacillus plantarum]|nr:hypothetical protein C7M38_01202 [Lactiplantibacillus plantarum]
MAVTLQQTLIDIDEEQLVFHLHKKLFEVFERRLNFR